MHFAKTGTDVSEDRDATVGVWIAGGLQFASGPAYSYVVLVGTGNTRQPWARSVHAADIAPLAEVLLQELAEHAARGKPAKASARRQIQAGVCSRRGRPPDAGHRCQRASCENAPAAGQRSKQQRTVRQPEPVFAPRPRTQPQTPSASEAGWPAAVPQDLGHRRSDAPQHLQQRGKLSGAHGEKA